MIFKTPTFKSSFLPSKHDNCQGMLKMYSVDPSIRESVGKENYIILYVLLCLHLWFKEEWAATVSRPPIFCDMIGFCVMQHTFITEVFKSISC